MKIYLNKHQSAILCHSRHGPSFGGGHDIYIYENAKSDLVCDSNLGSTYLHPEYEYDSNEPKSFLAGSFRFKLSEIEIYKID